MSQKKTMKDSEEKPTKKTTKTTKKLEQKAESEVKKEEKPIESSQEANSTIDKAEEEKIDKIAEYRKAGEIAKKIKEYIRPKIKPGAKLTDLCEDAENKIRELGGKPGFPVNICINHIAAHYTPAPGEQTTIQDGDVVKFDMGVHTGHGYVVDTAFTVNLNKDPSLKDLVKSCEEAVEVAIGLMKPGMKTNHIGAQIEKTVKKYNFVPIRELSGHKIEQWSIHGGKSIPCVATPPGSGETIEQDEVYAIEVFSSNGEGRIHAQQNVQIFSLTGARLPLRNQKAKQIYSYIANEYKTLPFSRLQIYKQFPQSLFGLIEIIRSKRLTEHNILSEEKGKGIYVAQAEQTVLITKDGCELLT